MSKFTQYFYPNSKILKSEGNEIDGKMEGEWKFYREDGTLESKGTYKDGNPDGHFYYYHENGQESANGVYKGEKREGDWIWHFDNGGLNQHGSYIDGKLQGPYNWFHQTGEPSTVGAFKNGERDGYWEWTNVEGAITYQMNYDEGKRIKFERSFTQDGKQLLLEKHYEDGTLHGDFKAFYTDGSPKEEAHYIHGFLHGVHLIWEDGKKKKKEYDNGVPILTEKRWKSLAGQIDKKRDYYDKMDVIEKVASYDARVRSILYMFKEGYLDFNKHADLWSEIDDDIDTLSSEEFVKLLKGVKLTKKQLENSNCFLPFWPLSLDKISMHLYAQDPKPFDEMGTGYSQNVLEGIRLVQIRFGTQDKSCLKKDIAKELAKQHLHDYGIGLSGGGIDGSFSNVWMYQDGKVVEVNISDTGRGHLPNEAFYDFIELFTSREEWEKALLKDALTFEWNLPMPHAMDAVKIASIQEFAILYKAFSTSTYNDFYWALTELRNDSIEDLEFLTKGSKRRLSSRAVVRMCCCNSNY